MFIIITVLIINISVRMMSVSVLVFITVYAISTLLVIGNLGYCSCVFIIISGANAGGLSASRTFIIVPSSALMIIT